MAQIVKLRRSSVAGQKPTNANLQLGELAINTTDGKVFLAKSGSGGPSVEEIVTTNTVNTGSLNLIGSVTASEFSGSYVGDGGGLYNVPTASYSYTASYVLNIPQIGVEGSTQKLTVNTPSTTWNFNHGLGERYPAIQVFDGEGKVVIPTSIETLDENNLSITFSLAQVGVATATIGGGLPAQSPSDEGYILRTNGSYSQWQSFETSGLAITGSNTFIGDQTISGSLFVSGGTELGGDIFPQTPQGATLGTADKPFRELFLQSGSITIESDTPGDPSAVISNNDGNLDISVGGMRLVESGNSFIAETGSFQFISGSMTQIGDYIRIGDTITTGSVNFSGSFEASLQEDYVWMGNSNGRSTPTTIDQLASSGSLVKSAYGSFYSTQNQAGVANQIQVITHNVTDFASGVSMVSGSQITFAEAGIYTLISTMQYQETGNGTATITGWLRKNGVDVADSATDLKLKGNGDRDLYAINYFVSASAGDYVEFCWSSSDVDTEILYIAPRTSPTRPAVPSVITTVNRVG